VSIDDSVAELRGVGDEIAKKLKILGIETISDLIENVPRRYDDYSQVTDIKNLRPGVVTLKVTINNVTGRYVRRGMHITEALASDSSGSVRLTWFNQPYRANSINASSEYYVSGEYALRRSRFSIANPSLELVSDFPVNTARIIPIYRETKGLKSAVIRKLIREVNPLLTRLPEHLPEWLIKNQNLTSYSGAIMEMHFPSSADTLAQAKKRLGFEEVFELSLAALINKNELSKNNSLAIPFDERLAKHFVESLGFKLTNAQRKAAWRIYQDMARKSPMNRLLEGDVGAGKTVVAAMSALMAVSQGFQVAVMAPTEILARQHSESFYNLFGLVGLEDKVGLLIGGLAPKQKKMAQERISSGDIKLIVGTHALISEKVNMHNLGLIIIDEQHRFGVEQRKKLQLKAGHMPHILHMTATPIPRSLALTLYGELDISVIDEMPPGRKKIITEICSPNSVTQLNLKIKQELSSGRQMFIVCPLISETDYKIGLSAEHIYDRVAKIDFKELKVGLLHGKMKSVEKDKVMQSFIDKDIDILVSTTVIEVGVDVPNASIMLIIGAERFGLAQIHQLRGRVGRGAEQSFCYLMLSDSSAPGPRLEAIKNTSDGFALAELDLRLRGPGAIYGSVQHGALDLRVASLTDLRLIAAARNAANEFLSRKENIKKYPYLNSRVTTLRAVTNLS
jgi:ATP-dependent DNA helicase RecG